MKVLLTIKKFFGGILSFGKKNPTVTAIIVIIILIMLFLQQCNKNKDLKREIATREAYQKQEDQRHKNNLKALGDTVKILKEDTSHMKQILAAREGEIEYLDGELAKEKERIKKVISVKEVPKFIYITELASNVSTSDVETKIEKEGNTFGVGIETENQLFKLKTRTWFNLNVDSFDKVILINPADKYGKNRPSKLDYESKFKLSLTQTELQDGSKRIYIRATDLNGDAIDPTLLGISYIKGVDFIDVPSTPVPKPTAPVKKSRFAGVIGPSVILSPKPPFIHYGVGVTIGYKFLGK